MTTTQSPISTFATQTEAVKQLIEFLGENPQREGLQGTPERAVKALSLIHI